MQLRIDVQDTSGNNLGAGPIMSGSNWRRTFRLDRGGDFSFQMPMADPMYAALVVERRWVKAWQLVGGTMSPLLGLGIIDTINEDSVADPSVATIIGSDLMRELTWRSVKGLLIAERGYVNPEDVHFLELDSSGSGQEASPNLYTDEPYFRDANTGTYATLGDGQYDYWYVGYSRPFDEVKIVLHTVRTAGGNVTKVQYFNGSGWVDFTFADNNFVNGTNGAHNSFEQNGSWTWDIPADWVSLTQNCRVTGDPDNNKTEYWIRFNNQAGTGVSLADLYIGTDIETLTGAQLIMALAPAGWSLTGATTTLTAVYLQLGDETVLEALGELAAITGEHFRIGGSYGSGRQIEWLGTTAADSGVVATRNGDPAAVALNPAACLIAELHSTHDSFDLVSRVIPYGAGSGSARLTLEKTTRSAGTGYTLSAANNYIENNAAEATYGQVERVVTWSNIGPATDANADTVAAANALYDAALYWLTTHCVLVESYSAKTYGLSGIIKPGDTIHVDWQEVVAGAVVRSVNADLIVLEADYNIDRDGVLAGTFLLSNLARWPMSESDTLAQLLGSVGSTKMIVQPVPLGSIKTGSTALKVVPTAGGFGGLDYS